MGTDVSLSVLARIRKSSFSALLEWLFDTMCGSKGLASGEVESVSQAYCCFTGVNNKSY